MNILQMSIDERLVIYRTAIMAALANEAIIAILTKFGFSREVIEALKALYERTYALHQDQKREYGEKFGASDDYTEARRVAIEKYMSLIELARFALRKDREWLKQLDLQGDRETAYAKCLVQMEQFYDTALLENNTELRDKLARRGVTLEDLQAGKALVDDMITKRSAQFKEAGEAQRATRDRNVDLEQLDDEAMEFIQVSRIALKSEPELLESMGLVDPS